MTRSRKKLNSREKKGGHKRTSLILKRKVFPESTKLTGWPSTNSFDIGSFAVKLKWSSHSLFHDMNHDRGYSVLESYGPTVRICWENVSLIIFPPPVKWIMKRHSLQKCLTLVSTFFVFFLCSWLQKNCLPGQLWVNNSKHDFYLNSKQISLLFFETFLHFI